MAIEDLQTKSDVKRFVQQEILDQPGAIKQPAVQGLPDALDNLDPPYLSVTQHAAPADADIATGELTIWFDQTAGAAKLMVKAKNASGTVVTGSLALA